MYILKIDHHFDSAHFLSGYDGKCGNIHGHRWNVIIEIQSENLIKCGQETGMVVDFKNLKKCVKDMIDYYDHCLIIEEKTLADKTLNCLLEDGFKVVQVHFRPTAENFAAFFYLEMKKKGFNVKRSTVYETPSNCATYEEGGDIYNEL